MSLSLEDVKKIAHLARLSLSENDTPFYAEQLSRILEFIEHMSQVDTKSIPALSHPLDLCQRLRPDEVTEADYREKFQEIAPKVEAGLYLVPKVIEEA